MAAYKFSNNFSILAIGALGLAALASTGYLLITGRAESKKHPEEIVQQHEKKRVFYNNVIVHNADGIMLELLASDNTPESWSGINLQISPAVSNKWALYAPVSISVPELNYIAPFPAEDGATGAKVTFAKPLSLEERITFMITGNTRIPGPRKHNQPVILFNKYMQVKDLPRQVY